MRCVHESGRCQSRIVDPVVVGVPHGYLHFVDVRVVDIVFVVVNVALVHFVAVFGRYSICGCVRECGRCQSRRCRIHFVGNVR